MRKSECRFRENPAPLRDDDGRIIGGINMLADITEVKPVDHTKLAEQRAGAAVGAGGINSENA